jgi:ABC-2 type transport system ATP-binding protein
VAAALLRDPQLLVLDEPANGLDPAGIRDMRALVKRLADEGLTVLLSSHDMGEVEEICDNVTIMRKGDVVYHGGIAELRERAPAQGHRIWTDADDVALGLAGSREGLEVTVHPQGGLLAHGSQERVDALVTHLVTSGLALRQLELTEAPLEQLFFMLTESTPADDVARENAHDLAGASR